MQNTVLFLLSISTCVIITKGEYPWDPIPKNEEWWLERHAGYIKNTQDNAGNISVVFFGDSITDDWGSTGRSVFDEYYTPLGAANYGIGSDQCQHNSWRIYNGEVDGISPKVAVLKVGTNNIGGWTNNEVAAGVLATTRALRWQLPNTKVLLLGILPRIDAWNNAQVREINEQIRTADNGNAIRFLDMFQVFCKGEEDFERDLFSNDLLHLTTAGYRAWAETMAPLFNEMMTSNI